MGEEKKGDLTVREAGRIGGKKGGQTTRERYGRPFYEQIGRKGGETVRETHGHEFYEESGRKGGQTVRDERGHEFYEEIGHKGGQKVRELIEAGKGKQEEEERWQPRSQAP